jgi:hypothetical protein
LAATSGLARFNAVGSLEQTAGGLDLTCTGENTRESVDAGSADGTSAAIAASKCRVARAHSAGIQQYEPEPHLHLAVGRIVAHDAFERRAQADRPAAPRR